MNGWLPGIDLGPNPWHQVSGSDPRVLALVDGWHPAAAGAPHYSRQNPGSLWFTGPGESVAFVTTDGLAVWSCVYHRVGTYSHDDGRDAEMRWRCNVFRRLEGAARASDLIRAAVAATKVAWIARYGRVPPLPLTTEVDPGRVRRKRDPGRCFLRAGWTVVGTTKSGLLVLQEPGQGSGS
jgi:hypothetical protein